MSWLFKLLFRKDYEHMRHLVDDVIRLERDKSVLKVELSKTRGIALRKKRC